MSAPHIAAQRAAWLQALCADREVNLSTLRVAVIIGNHVNGQIGEAWPSQSTIARLLEMKRHNVNRSIATLVSIGYLTVRKDGQSNHYSMATRIRPDTTTGIQMDTGQPLGSEHLNTARGIQRDIEPSPAGYPICEEPREGGAYSAPLGMEYVDSLVAAHRADDQDRAPKGAVLTDDHVELAEICFGQLREPEFIRLRAFASRIGEKRFTTELVNLGQRMLLQSLTMPVEEWIDLISQDAGREVAHA